MNAAARIVPGTPGWPSPGATGPFTTDRDWLPFHPDPSRPLFRPPPGAVDAHCHVFGPGERFPYAPERKYTPCDAPKEKLWALRDYLGFERNVLVQATCHGTDNRALVDALNDARGRARGVATVGHDVSDAELRALDAAGVRGVRFNFVRRLVDVTPQEVLAGIARRVAPLGWHVVIYFEAADLPGLYAFLASLPTTIVIDHMGRPDVTQPVDGPGFELFVRLMREHPQCLVEGELPGAVVTAGPARLRRLRALRAPARRAVPGSRAVGHGLASSKSEVAYAGRRTTGRSHPGHRSYARAPPRAARRQPDAAVLVATGAPLMSLEKPYADVPGTTIFDADQARRGYHLNQFCMSLMKAENRARFKADERAYLDEWPMSEEQKQAMLARDYGRLIQLGGNIYFLAKVFSTDGQTYIQAVSTMTGMSVEEYRNMMMAGGRPIAGNRYVGEKK